MNTLSSATKGHGFYKAFSSAATSVEKIVENLGRAYRLHKTVHALSGLSDHELSDIGLSRGEIRGAAQRALH